jgi:hypothetical protein
MTKLFFACALSFLALTGLTVSSVGVEKDADVRKLTEQVEKLLAAYNKDDIKAFFTDWSKDAKQALGNQPVYDALYKNGAKIALGEYVPKTLKFRKEGSVLDEETPAVYFEAEFSKEKVGVIAINFMKEDGEYRFVQVIMDKKK